MRSQRQAKTAGNRLTKTNNELGRQEMRRSKGREKEVDLGSAPAPLTITPYPPYSVVAPLVGSRRQHGKGRPTLNKLKVMVSTPHLYMKYPVGMEVGVIRVNQNIACHCYENNLRVRRRPTNYEGASNSRASVNFLDLDPRQLSKEQRPRPAEDLKEDTKDENQHDLGGQVKRTANSLPYQESESFYVDPDRDAQTPTEVESKKMLVRSSSREVLWVYVN
ncbi:hypothetical protein CR513_06179, partial [Mucuna pruriens]